MDKFLLEVAVADERDGDGRENHPTYEAMHALLDALNEKLPNGFRLHYAVVIDGAVDRDGVTC